MRAALAPVDAVLLTAPDGPTALHLARTEAPCLVVLDVMMPGMTGFEVCARLKDDPATADITVLFLSSLEGADFRVQGLQLGAVDFVAKPVEPAELVARVRTHLELRRLQTELRRELQVARELLADAARRSEGPLLGASALIRGVRRQLDERARDLAPILLVGPPGAGAEAAARHVHAQSGRAPHVFIRVDCTAHDASLTLADKVDLGRSGTLYLESVDRLPVEAQATLAWIDPEDDVKLVASCTPPTELEPALRRQLGSAIRLPPLAHRWQDVDVIASFYANRRARVDLTIEDASLQRLRSHDWPGNVHELQTVVERAVDRADTDDDVLVVPPSLLSGGQVGAYRLQNPLGEGGMGTVWAAEHELLARPAAVKLIRRDSTTAGARERFLGEARATARLVSPNTVRVFDFGTSARGDFYYVMERLDGFDLRTAVERFGPLPVERAVDVLVQACRSLEEAHSLDLIHRDIKPSNLFLTRLGSDLDVVKVLDFGVVGVRGAPAEELVGTIGYMAPEVLLQYDDVDARSDLYALGCVAVWLLTGRPVFDGHTPKRIYRHLSEVPKRLDGVPGSLADLVAALLSKEPEHRPADARAVRMALQDVPVKRAWTEDRAAAWWAAATSATIAPLHGARDGRPANQSPRLPLQGTSREDRGRRDQATGDAA